MLHGLLIFIEIISALLLITFILLQKTKDEGLGLAFGAGVGETLFGSRAGNVLTKITIGLAVVFLADTLLLGYLASGTVSSGSITDRLPASAPALPGPGPVSGLPAAMPTPEAAPPAESTAVESPAVPAPTATPVVPAPSAP